MESVAVGPSERYLGICGWVSRLVVNNPDLVDESRYFDGLVLESLLTNIHKVDRFPGGHSFTSEVSILDDPAVAPAVRHGPGILEARGDFTRLERECPDRRYSIFGNLGLFFRFAMAEMEDFGLFSFHASALYRESDHRLILLVGGPGVGKTVFILGGIQLGYRVLSAEMVHVAVDRSGTRFYKGALIDNIRVGTLLEDFPEAVSAIGVELPRVDDVWATKIAVDLTQVATAEDVLVNPRLEVLFPRVERGCGDALVTPVKDPRVVARLLYENLSEKIAQSFLLYDQIPVGSFDSPERALRRGEFVSALVPYVGRACRVLTGPRQCIQAI